MKYKIFGVLLILCMLAGCKIEYPSQVASTAPPSSLAASSAADSSQPVTGEPEADAASSQSSRADSVPQSSAPAKPALPQTVSSAASSKPSVFAKAPASSALPASTSTPAKQTVCTISISCGDILTHKDRFDADLLSIVPPGGSILPELRVAYTPGESVFDVLMRAAGQKGIRVDHSSALGTEYIQAIGNIREKDFGTSSGWTYRVNGTQPSIGCSGYKLKSTPPAPNTGYQIQWVYVCGS